MIYHLINQTYCRLQLSLEMDHPIPSSIVDTSDSTVHSFDVYVKNLTSRDLKSDFLKMKQKLEESQIHLPRRKLFSFSLSGTSPYFGLSNCWKHNHLFTSDNLNKKLKHELQKIIHFVNAKAAFQYLNVETSNACIFFENIVNKWLACSIKVSQCSWFCIGQGTSWQNVHKFDVNTQWIVFQRTNKIL